MTCVCECSGSTLSFEVNKREAFEVPLSDVASTTVGGKTDVNLVFQQSKPLKREDEVLVRVCAFSAQPCARFWRCRVGWRLTLSGVPFLHVAQTELRFFVPNKTTEGDAENEQVPAVVRRTDRTPSPRNRAWRADHVYRHALVCDGWIRL